MRFGRWVPAFEPSGVDLCTPFRQSEPDAFWATFYAIWDMEPDFYYAWQRELLEERAPA